MSMENRSRQPDVIKSMPAADRAAALAARIDGALRRLTSARAFLPPSSIDAGPGATDRAIERLEGMKHRAEAIEADCRALVDVEGGSDETRAEAERALAALTDEFKGFTE